MMSATTTTPAPQGEPAALRMALKLLENGLWPVPIHPLNQSDGKSSGKRPIGVDWGMKRHTPESLRKVWANYPTAGVGIKLGKEAGVIDFDVDDPETGDDTFLRVVGGELVETFGWSSERGYHALFRWDDRLAEYGAVTRSHPNYPGLELRFGDDGTTGKQYQTVVPPSPDTKGNAREWNRVWEIVPLPECAYADFRANLIAHETTPLSVPTATASLGLVVSMPTASGELTVEERARRYVAKMPESVSGQAGHDRLYNVAAVLVGDFLLTYDKALPIFREWNLLYAKPPESEAQVAHKLADACKHAAKTGRLAGAVKAVEVVEHKPIPGVAASRDDVATAADLARIQAGIEWVWEGWIQKGVLCLLAAEAGTGKTRFCLDLAKRVWLGLPWPDGKPATFPIKTPVLWIPADGNHSELSENPPKFGFPLEAIYLNAPKSDPFGGTELVKAEQLALLEWHIRCVSPALVFIDTITNTSDLKSQDASDAKKQYKPLQEIAQKTGTAIVCITHLNKQGTTLGGRADEKVRTTMRMTWPDKEGQPHRRALKVTKSNSMMPPALGVTMGDSGNDYDLDPPKAPENTTEVYIGGNGAQMTQVHPRQAECVEWLRDTLAFGDVRVGEIRRTGEANGFSTKTIYKAKDMLGIIESGEKGSMTWTLRTI